MPAEKSTLTNQTVEIRFDRGYKYFDRCGEVFLILEDVLTQDTEKLWLVGDVKPQGSVIRCPDLDAMLVLDSKHLVIEQDPVISEFDFIRACRTAWAVVETRFGITEVTRAGSKRTFTVVTDTFDEAERLSVRHSPVGSWLTLENAEFAPRSADVTCDYATADRKRGVRLQVNAVMKLGTPLQIDDRLRVPPHLQNKDQHEAQVAQIRRRREQEKNPDCGMVIDVDVYELFPEKFKIEPFLTAAHAQDEKIRGHVLRAKS